MKNYSLSALVAAGLLAGGLATSANAADLGGNCCADLEERIAELEATTARKGNRKVSLTISGWVAEQVTYWDDGHETNTYVTGIGTTLGTNVKFTGQATITPGYSAGYVIHLEMDGSDSLVGTNQNTPDGNGLFTSQGAGLADSGHPNYVQTLQAFWFLKSDHLGKVSVGLQSMAADNAAILVDGSGSLVVANWVGFNTEGFFMRRTDANAPGSFGYTSNIWAQAGACNNGGDCYGIPINGVRYDSPTYAGFSVSTGWGEDDYWDMAARYAGEVHDFKLAATVAYGQSTCQLTGPIAVSSGCPFSVNFGDTQYFQAGVYAQHVRTGLWVLFDYGLFELDEDFYQRLTGRTDIPDSHTYYVKAGIRRSWHPLGATIVYGEFQHNDDGGAQTGAFAGNPTSSTMEWWGAGVVQEIDAAAMSVWLRWRETTYDDNGVVNGVHTSYDDLQEVTFGGLINF